MLFDKKKILVTKICGFSGKNRPYYSFLKGESFDTFEIFLLIFFAWAPIDIHSFSNGGNFNRKATFRNGSFDKFN